MGFVKLGSLGFRSAQDSGTFEAHQMLPRCRDRLQHHHSLLTLSDIQTETGELRPL
jgi:hypothetical protein